MGIHSRQECASGTKLLTSDNSDSETNGDAETDGDTESDGNTGPEVDTETVVDTEAEVDAETEVDAAPDCDTEPDVGSGDDTSGVTPVKNIVLSFSVAAAVGIGASLLYRIAIRFIIVCSYIYV